MVKIKDIARLAHVSQSTVSKALNNRSDVSELTRERILNIVREQGSSLNLYRRGKGNRSTESIGVIFLRESQPLSGNPFYSRVLEGIEAEAAVNNYNLLLKLIPKSREGEIPKMIRDRQVDGVVLIGISNPSFINEIKAGKIPVVLLDPKVLVEGCSKVMIDNEHGAFMITSYLLDLGHRRIGFISGDLSTLSFKQRFDGYLKALRAYKIQKDKSLIQTGGLEKGKEHVHKLLSLENKPTAIFAANDINAIYGYNAVREMKMNIPEDLSFAGYDDIDLSRFSTPPLTSVRVYKEELGSIAVRNLLKIVKGEIREPTTTLVPVKLIKRESVKRLNGAD